MTSSVMLLMVCAKLWIVNHAAALVIDLPRSAPHTNVRQRRHWRHSDPVGRGVFTPRDSPHQNQARTPSSPVALSSVAIETFSTALSSLDTFYKTMPLASAFVTCGFKASAADLVAQKRQAKMDAEEQASDIISAESDTIQIEKRRNFAFLMYGGAYQGVAQYEIFNGLFPILFGDGTDVVTVASKVLFDSLVITPFICLPVAYLVKGIIFQYSLGESFSRYKNDIVRNGLLIKYWSLWGPVQCLTFGVIPQHLRIVFIAFISFFWLVIFSSITAKGQRDREMDVEECSLEDGVTCKIDG